MTDIAVENITNFYEHCDNFWELHNCDSIHNDRCQLCNKEIEPYDSMVESYILPYGNTE